MSKENGVVHFTIGGNFGKVLTDIAREKIFCEYDVMKAIATLEKSLAGITLDVIIKVLSGEKILEVEESTQMVVVNDFNADIHDEPTWGSIDEWVNLTYHQTLKAFSSLNLGLAWAKNNFDKFERYGFDIDFDVSTIVKYVFSENDTDEFDESVRDTVLEAFEHNDSIEKAKNLIRISKQLVLKTLKIVQCIKHLNNTGLYKDEVRTDMYTSNLLARAEGLQIELAKISFGDFNDPAVDDLVKYLKDNKEINKVLAKGIQPVNVIHGTLHDAYWVAPNGDAYGLSGHIANMLHYQMAVAIINNSDVDDSVIDDDTAAISADSQLGRDGWCKVTNNWVLYDGYHYNKPLTKEQQQTIANIGKKINLEKKTFLKVGLRAVQMTGVMFGMIDPLMMKKHLSL